MRMLTFINCQAKIDRIAAEPNEAGITAREKMNLNPAIDSARDSETKLKTNGSSLRSCFDLESEMVLN